MGASSSNKKGMRIAIRVLEAKIKVLVRISSLIRAGSRYKYTEVQVRTQSKWWILRKISKMNSGKLDIKSKKISNNKCGGFMKSIMKIARVHHWEKN